MSEFGSMVSRIDAGADWLVAHGNDLVPVKMVDLMSLLARLRQADDEGRIEYDASAAERLITCDLPRLSRYLPTEARRILGDE